MAGRNGNGIRMLTVRDVQDARKHFLEGEPRNLFYVVAIELIDLARKGTTKISVAQALAVLLQTWNMNFYRFRGKFGEGDLERIEALVNDHLGTLETFRERSVTSVAPAEENTLKTLFGSFRDGLGAVGAAKCLHLLAPHFFPLWDTAIAKAYHVKLDEDGYIRFMRIAKNQCQTLQEQGASWPDVLKAVDEYNYCTFTMKS